MLTNTSTRCPAVARSQISVVVLVKNATLRGSRI